MERSATLKFTESFKRANMVKQIFSEVFVDFLLFKFCIRQAN